MSKCMCILIIALLLCSCAVPKYSCHEEVQRAYEQMTALYCEDAALVGYTAAYLGDLEWKKLTNSFNAARAKSEYNLGCKLYNPHWYGRMIHKEQ